MPRLTVNQPHELLCIAVTRLNLETRAVIFKDILYAHPRVSTQSVATLKKDVYHQANLPVQGLAAGLREYAWPSLTCLAY